MVEKNGEINISPKIIYFIESPNIIGEEEKLEFLKRDILVIEQNGDIENLCHLVDSKNKNAAYFYSLENILLKNRIKKDDVFNFSANIATFIKNFLPYRSLVHASFIDNEIANVFRQEGIPYLEKTLNDKKSIFAVVMSTIKPFFIERQRMVRSSIRLNLAPEYNKAEIINLSNKYEREVIHAYIKDISLTGIGLILRDKFDYNLLKMKNKLTLRLFLNRTIIRINASFLTRISKENNEIGISFDITDGHMIREDYANRFTAIIYNWLRTLINSNHQNGDELIH